MTRILALLLLAGLALAQNPTTRAVTIAWSASASTGVSGYKVYRGDGAAGANMRLLTPTPTNVLSFVDSAAVGQVYTYFVTAVGPPCAADTTMTTACGESAPGYVTIAVPPRPATTVTVTAIVQ
jgi:hypothetical protein